MDLVLVGTIIYCAIGNLEVVQYLKHLLRHHFVSLSLTMVVSQTQMIGVKNKI